MLKKELPYEDDQYWRSFVAKFTELVSYMASVSTHPQVGIGPNLLQHHYYTFQPSCGRTAQVLTGLHR
jgi:hypothetical protein